MIIEVTEAQIAPGTNLYKKMDTLDWVRVDRDLLLLGKGYIDENFKHVDALQIRIKTNKRTGDITYFK